MPLKYNHKRIKQSLDHAKMQGTYDDEDLEMEREGWKAILWVLPAFLFLSYLIAHFVVYLWS